MRWVSLWYVGRSVCLSVTLMSPAKTAELIEMMFGLWAQMGPRNHVLDGVQIFRGKGQFWGKGRPLQSIGTLCGHLCENSWTNRFAVWVVDSEWAEGNTSSIVFARWRQCVLPCGHIGATWRIRLNRPSAAVIRSYVKLLWPLVQHGDRPSSWTCYARVWTTNEEYLVILVVVQNLVEIASLTWKRLFTTLLGFFGEIWPQMGRRIKKLSKDV